MFECSAEGEFSQPPLPRRRILSFQQEKYKFNTMECVIYVQSFVTLGAEIKLYFPENFW